MDGDRPDAVELVLAVREYLDTTVRAAAASPTDERAVSAAVWALEIVERELRAGDAPGLTRAELEELSRRIRSGDVPADALATLKQHVAAKLRLSNPAFLDRYNA
jgi:hypothetical protein